MKYILSSFFIFSLYSLQAEAQNTLLNTSHLDHLYEEVVIGTDTMGIIHIYAEYPDYEWFDDSDEGSACVDDGARAMIFYLKHHKQTGVPESLHKAKRLLNYIFYMQSDSGWFYNFTWKDNSINKEFRTSVAEPNWWSWRALWALAEANHFFKNDDELTAKIKSALNRLLNVLLPWLNSEEKYAEYSGFRLPAWLPYGTAADQGAIILKSFAIYYNDEKDEKIIPYMRSLAKALMQMQAGDEDVFPHYAFLSWQNTWHGWGNSQSDALFAAGNALQDSSMINAALKEVRNFFSYLQSEKYLSGFSIEKDSLIHVVEQNKYSQIAYCFRPMIFAAQSACEITKDEYYAELAGKISCWFFGDNSNAVQMYDPKTGRCFDGIVDSETVNKNSGAESTIECLLSLLTVESNPVSKKILDEYTELNNK